MIEILDFPGYYITDSGQIASTHKAGGPKKRFHEVPHIMKPYPVGEFKIMTVKLKDPKTGRFMPKSVHALIARYAPHLLTAKPKKQKPACKWEGCQAISVGIGYCSKHRARVYYARQKLKQENVVEHAIHEATQVDDFT